MLKIKLFLLWFALKNATCNCNFEETIGFENIHSAATIKKLGQLPSVLNESSGIQYNAQSNLYYNHNDSGGEPTVYVHTPNGMLTDSLQFNLKNVDWEEITSDQAGNLYIGDFGNNRMSRKPLYIYKWDGAQVDTITFTYANQGSFPAKRPIFDCEAFFWYKGSLYLFTKSWEQKNPMTQLYRISDQPGSYSILPLDSLRIKTMVTAADVNPDGSAFVLQTYGKTLFFRIMNGEVNFRHPLYCRKTRRKQTEAITFKNDEELVFTNEQGEIFSMSFKK